MDGLGDRIRQARLALPGRQGRPLSREALAARLGIATTTLRQWELRGFPSADLLAALARELGVSADYLLGLEDHPKGGCTDA